MTEEISPVKGGGECAAGGRGFSEPRASDKPDTGPAVAGPGRNDPVGPPPGQEPRDLPEEAELGVPGVSDESGVGCLLPSAVLASAVVGTCIRAPAILLDLGFPESMATGIRAGVIVLPPALLFSFVCVATWLGLGRRGKPAWMRLLGAASLATGAASAWMSLAGPVGSWWWLLSGGALTAVAVWALRRSRRNRREMQPFHSVRALSGHSAMCDALQREIAAMESGPAPDRARLERLRIALAETLLWLDGRAPEAAAVAASNPATSPAVQASYEVRVAAELCRWRRFDEVLDSLRCEADRGRSADAVWCTATWIARRHIERGEWSAADACLRDERVPDGQQSHRTSLRAWVRNEAGNPAAARALLAGMMHPEPKIEAGGYLEFLLRAGQSALALGGPAEAACFIEHAVVAFRSDSRLDPDEIPVDWRVLRARTSAALGHAGVAEAELSACRAHVEGFAELHPLMLARVCEALAEVRAGAGRHADAVEPIDRAVELRRQWQAVPDHPHLSRALMMRAGVTDALGRAEDATAARAEAETLHRAWVARTGGLPQWEG